MSDRSSSSPRRPLARALTIAVVCASVLAACTPGGPSPTPAVTSALASDPSALGQASIGPTAAAQSAAPAPTVVVPQATSAAPQIAEADPDAEPFAMNLAGQEDFVAQYTFEWCVGASLQMALNMSTDQDRTSKLDQGDLWAMARDRSASPFGGANPRGWTAALNDLGIAPYRLVSWPTMDEALRVAAEAIRATDRPVGLVMWRGRHAWVMSGFESSDDPQRADEFLVTGIRVHDPLFPHGSTVWGTSPKPNSLVSPETLAEQFVVRDSTRVNLGVPPGYLLVLPVVQEA